MVVLSFTVTSKDCVISVVNLFSEKNGRVYEKLGDYYLVKNRKEDALESYEKGIAKDPDNYNLLKNTLLLQIDSRKYEEAQKELEIKKNQ